MKEAKRLLEIFDAYKIGVKTLEVHPGPQTTLYEVQPQLGVRISKIRNLKDEIAVGLQSENVRIIAPLPGKRAVGIEVPNKVREILTIEEMLHTPEYKNSGMELPIIFGRTVTNDVLMADLAKMPHLLIAGATGQGKSVCLNTILASLLNKKTPDELRLILIDPKQVEFSLYNELGENSYLAKPIGTDIFKADEALTDSINLMEERYALLNEKGVRNIQEYNALDGVEKMPYLVFIIDEYGDLVMQGKNGQIIQAKICRIAQKARAVGIHLILSTQRPSVKIVNGDIKANFPTRIAFRTITSTDSRVVLGKQGAETLTGKGDMLLFDGEQTVRAQCAFISTEEAKTFCSNLREKYANWNRTPLLKPVHIPTEEELDGIPRDDNYYGEWDKFFGSRKITDKFQDLVNQSGTYDFNSPDLEGDERKREEAHNAARKMVNDRVEYLFNLTDDEEEQAALLEKLWGESRWEERRRKEAKEREETAKRREEAKERERVEEELREAKVARMWAKHDSEVRRDRIRIENQMRKDIARFNRLNWQVEREIKRREEREQKRREENERMARYIEKWKRWAEEHPHLGTLFTTPPATD